MSEDNAPKFKLLEDEVYYRLRHKPTGQFFHPDGRAHGKGKLYPKTPSLSYVANKGSKTRDEWEVVKYMLIEIVP